MLAVMRLGNKERRCCRAVMDAGDRLVPLHSDYDRLPMTG
jgi:hypothetical protein